MRGITNVSVTDSCFRHGRHAGTALLTPHLRAYRCGTAECYYILCWKASDVQHMEGRADADAGPGNVAGESSHADARKRIRKPGREQVGFTPESAERTRDNAQ